MARPFSFRVAESGNSRQQLRCSDVVQRRSLVFAQDQNRVSLGPLGITRADTGVVKASSSIGVAIFVEANVAARIACIHFYVGSGDRLMSRCIRRLQLPESFAYISR